MKVIVVSEDNHGLIQIAKDRDSAIDYLISTSWVNGCCELWFPERQDSICIEDLHPDWQNWLRNTATDDDFINLGFYLREYEVYTK